jgi:hypothetical protein
MSERVYGPDETWPSHDLPRWQEALKIARVFGWSLHKFDGHWFGMISCPSGEHTKPVDCTARNTEIKAKEARKAVEKTCHCAGSRPASATARKILDANNKLDSAENLLNHAEHLCADLQARTDVETQLEELAHLEGVIDAAATNLAELQDAALAAALALEETDPPAGDPYVLLQEAGDHIASAECLASQLRRPDQRRLVADRARAATTRLIGLRTWLERLKEPSRPADC